MDYLITQTFFSNSDWYNQKYARSTDGKMKWRPILYDLDWSLKHSASSSVLGSFFNPNGIEIGEVDPIDGTRNKVETSLFYAFYKNTAWRKQFVQRYAEILNTLFMPEVMLAKYDAMVDSIKEEMPRHIKRWGTPSSVSKWNNEVKRLRNTIAQRRKYVKQSLKSFFHLSDSEMKKLFPDG